MAKYTDSELAARVVAVLYSNNNGEIDAVELRDLLLDFVDSKLNSSASIGAPVSGTINTNNLVNDSITITHNLNSYFPIVFIKSPSGEIWSEAHFTQSPVNENNVLIHFEEIFDTGDTVEYIIVKFS